MTFAAPAVLFALVALPAIWWLLRLMPPRSKAETFPPTSIVAEIHQNDETPANTPWWLLLLRLLLATILIVALAGPTIRPESAPAPGQGPLLLVLDNSWAAGADWQKLRDEAISLAAAAGENERTVALLAAAERPVILGPTNADEIIDRMGALEPMPLLPDYNQMLAPLRGLPSEIEFGGVAWVSAGLGGDGTEELATFFSQTVAGPTTIYTNTHFDINGLLPPTNAVDRLLVPIVRSKAGDRSAGTVLARDIQGRIIGEAAFSFSKGETASEASFSLPVEIRNEIVRLEIDGLATAGAVQLLDNRHRRHVVGVVSGDPVEQPLLSAEYYIARALAPFADLRSSGADTGRALADLTSSGASIIILADIGTLPADAESLLVDWIERGGILIRFAGPRLAAAEPSLIPVDLRLGGRTIGGALSWEEPQSLGPFPPASPFTGLEVPDDILVSRQVLAEPNAELGERTWAVLADGTPLVTAANSGSGRIVLFHVTADTSWSNLPLSGVFVDMLRRILDAATTTRESDQQTFSALRPYRVLDGYGRFTEPGESVEALSASVSTITVDVSHPPGLYGSESGFRAVNLLTDATEVRLIKGLTIPGLVYGDLPRESAAELGPWFLATAFALLLADTLVVLSLRGALALLRAQGAGLALGAILFLPATSVDGAAQQGVSAADVFALEAANRTALAYVVTGDSESDRISRAGLTGLSWVLASRTSFEPGDPIGVDIGTDELSFFPILYWRLSPDAPLPNTNAMARLEAYMRGGGIVLFDTADQLERGAGNLTQATTVAARRLQEVLSGVDIPPLEPVRPDHVLTRTYYLLQSFPGRYSGGDFWVETVPDQDRLDGEGPARPTDEVSPILITSNDLAAAWAIEESGAFLFPMVSSDPRQREFAFRTGINIVMYALTGNYKNDQVHIPDLLLRLGQ